MSAMTSFDPQKRQRSRLILPRRIAIASFARAESRARLSASRSAAASRRRTASSRLVCLAPPDGCGVADGAVPAAGARPAPAALTTAEADQVRRRRAEVVELVEAARGV